MKSLARFSRGGLLQSYSFVNKKQRYHGVALGPLNGIGLEKIKINKKSENGFEALGSLNGI